MKKKTRKYLFLSIRVAIYLVVISIYFMASFIMGMLHTAIALWVEYSIVKEKQEVDIYDFFPKSISGKALFFMIVLSLFLNIAKITFSEKKILIAEPIEGKSE